MYVMVQLRIESENKKSMRYSLPITIMYSTKLEMNKVCRFNLIFTMYIKDALPVNTLKDALGMKFYFFKCQFIDISLKLHIMTHFS